MFFTQADNVECTTKWRIFRCKADAACVVPSVSKQFINTIIMGYDVTPADTRK